MLTGAPVSARVGRPFIRLVLEQASTANGVLLVIQAVLAQPPYDEVLPPYIYVWVNAAVVLLAGIARISAILGSNHLISRWLRPDDDASAEVGENK